MSSKASSSTEVVQFLPPPGSYASLAQPSTEPFLHSHKLGSGTAILSEDDDGSDIMSSASESDDIAYHFKLFGMTEHLKWYKQVYKAGYRDMDELKECDFSEVADEVGMKSGNKAKFIAGMKKFQSGLPGNDRMPQHDLGATAPVQNPADLGKVNWRKVGGAAFACAAVGAPVAVAVAGAIAAETALITIGLRAAGGFALCGALGEYASEMGIDCLDGDSEITLPDRSTKKVRELKAGEKVLSFNKGKVKIRTILEVKTGESNDMRNISVEHANGVIGVIKATAGHPFFAKEKGWSCADPVKATFNGTKPDTLEVGDTLTLCGGEIATVTRISQPSGKISTFNLLVDGPGTFFVNGVLSHSGLAPRS